MTTSTAESPSAIRAVVWRPPASAPALNWVLGALLVVCIVRTWLMPLTSSLWVDEMATEFVVHHGATDPTLQVAPQVAESAYYAWPKLAEHLFGFSEAAYRLPSVLFLAVALLLIGCIAARAVHPQAGWLAVFTCLALKGFTYQACDARPYAMATLVACASLWLLIRWFDTASWAAAAQFAITAALVWRVHLVLWPLYLLFAFYALVRLWRRDTPVRWADAGIVMASLGVSLVPVLKIAIALNAQAAAHVVAPKPSISELTGALKITLVAAFSAMSAGLSRRFRWPFLESNVDWNLVLGWWLCQPVCLFFYSWLTGNSVFVERYLAVALPGVALTTVAIVTLFAPARYLRPLAVAVGIGVLLFTGHWGRALPAHHGSDWRSAAQALNAQSSGATMPVICPSPFIEAKPPLWRSDYPLDSFLYSHLQTYPVTGQTLPFPFETSPEAEHYATQLTAGTLVHAGRFGIYGPDKIVLFWRAWFSARPEFAGWTIRQLGSFGDVEAILFEAPPAPAHEEAHPNRVFRVAAPSAPARLQTVEPAD